MGIGGRSTGSRQRLNGPTDVRLLALAFGAGILVVYASASLPPLWLLLPGLVLCLWRWPGRILLLAALFGAGWALVGAQQQLAVRLPASADGVTRVVQGHISSLPESGPLRARFAFASRARPERMRLSWYGDYPALQPGDCWRLTAKLSAPHGSFNPGGFDYEAWLWRQGFGATGYVREAAPCADDIWSIDRWRASASANIDEALAGHPSAALIRALALGDDRGLTDAQWEVLRRTGTTHLISVSGLHIGLIAALVFFVLRWLVPRLPGATRLPALSIAALGAGGAAVFYAALAGFSVPTQRSLWMVAVVLGAVCLRRRTAASQLLALALVAVLLAHPAAVLAPGFWLSFGAVAWILYLVCGRVGGGRGWRAWVLLQPRLALALIPLTLYWFSQASVVAPLANAIMIPACSLLLPVVLAAALLVNLAPGAGALLLAAVAFALDWGWGLLAWMATWPLSSVALAAAPTWAMLTGVAGIVLLLAPRGVPARWLGLIGLLPLLLTPAGPPPGAFRLVVLDVDQGLATVVRTAEHVLLFDTGPRYRTGFDAGAVLVLPFLRARGVGQLDRVVISHGDSDHRGGWPAVRAGIEVDSVLGATTANPCRVGQRWRWDGVEFAILHPAGAAGSDNDTSCVLRISGPGGRILLTGDIEAAAERVLLDRAGDRLAADILVVPHHGSDSSSTAAFVAAVAPTYAVVSAGWNNRWGFPDPVVVARYRAVGAEILETGKLGAIRFDFPPMGSLPPPRAWRREAGRFWNLPDVESR